ncbi:hypothetical protein V501_02617 [Pseudogymnoascus sp. VKM F-4519 (FW-2642)]|nr:hypothetical protein V501_02617 [Pseudogymnoascus sp. VKM F-4519 (FW-2642)]
MMGSLLDLVPDILTEIVRALSEDISLAASDKDLYRLALTCRQLFRITEPFLYTKLVFPDLRQAKQFLRTILEKPTYAAKVKYLALEQRDEDQDYEDEEEEHDDGNDDGEDTRGINTMEAKELAQLVEAYDNLGLPENIDSGRDDWISALRHQTNLAIGAIIALSLPNLESIQMEFPDSVEDSSKFICQAIQAATPQNLPSVAGRFLSNLREVRYFQTALEYIIPLNEIRSYFYLPSLRTLEVNHLSADAFTWSPPLTSCNIETLSLLSAGVENEAWGVIFRSMTNLKHLSYSPGNARHFNSISAVSALGENLTLVKSTLETLHMSDFYLGFGPPEDDFLGSLNDFPRLERLSIQIALLIGSAECKAEKALWEMLPRPLEDLEIYLEHDHDVEDREDVIEQVAEVVLRRESHFPGLRRLVVRSRRLQETGRAAELQEIQFPGLRSRLIRSRREQETGLAALQEICMVKDVFFKLWLSVVDYQ